MRRTVAVCLLLLASTFLITCCHAKLTPADYQEESQLILQALQPSPTSDPAFYAGQAWSKLAQLTDTVGNRVSGSNNLKRAVQYMLTKLQADGLENVHGEDVTVPHWKRGKEELVMLAPREHHHMNILGLGTSIGTPDGNPLVAEAIVAVDFDDLDTLGQAGKVTGKIVVLNPYCDWNASPIACYGHLGQYRSQGASHASKYGAVAYLVRSLASTSIGSPHTGYQGYAAGVKPIPAAALTTEDADALARMQAQGENITLSLYMEAENLPDEPSHNVVAELVGAEYPQEVVVVSGHLDSWDVGVGAMDDGGGAAISWQALSTLQQLCDSGVLPRAKRTVRLVMWSCEEFGGIGAQQYYDAHKDESDNFILVMESDLGAFKPKGLSFSGSPEATAVMQQVVDLLAPINASSLFPSASGGYETDTGPWQQEGVPGASLASHNEKYFAYHHSHGDQMSVLDKVDMDLAAAVFAVTAYVIADLDEPLPKTVPGHIKKKGEEGEEKGFVSVEEQTQREFI